MADDERLREVLLELQVLRDREARNLRDTQALLECLEAYSSALDPTAALSSIFVSLADKTDADLSMLLRIEDAETAVIVAAGDPDRVGLRIVPPFDLSKRSRNLLDLQAPGAWGGEADLAGFAGLVVVPASAGQVNYALLALKRAPGVFRSGDLNLVKRLSGLAAQADQARAMSEENKLLAATIAGSASGFAISDARQAHRPLIYVNEAFEKITGYAAQEVLGQNCRFLTNEPETSPERTRLRETVARNGRGRFLLRNRRKDGSPFWNELSLFPVTDASGAIQHLVATQNDVTERVLAEKDRDRSRARMEQALTATEDAFLILEADGRVAFANKAVNAIFPAPGMGWVPQTRFETNWQAYLEGSADLPGRITRLLVRPDLAALAERSSGQEIDLPDGRSVLVRASNLADGGRVISATDITPMKSAQRLLAQRLAAIEAAGEGIAITDNAGRLVYLNPSAAHLLGYDRAVQGLGKKWAKGYEEATGALARDGFSGRLNRRAGEILQTHEITCGPLETGGAVLVLRDITERLATEAREDELKRGLIRLQRQEAISQLAAGIAHDFNNLLSAINGSATLIGMQDSLPDQIRPHVDRIAIAGAQATRLINRLLDIGAPAEADGNFNLASALRDLPSLVAPSLTDRIRFDVTPEEHMHVLRGDPGALTQSLVNLVLNARDAMPEAGGVISLIVQPIAGRDMPPVRVGTPDPAGAYVSIDLSDTGTGMDQVTLEHALSPYFTTKGQTGTGLGLASVSMQVKSIGGCLGIVSRPGKGTTVTLYWPMAQAETPDIGLPGDGNRADLSGRTVLIVDDDPHVAQVLATYLEARGAEASVCEDPRDALEVIAEDASGWSALVTDYDMPRMTGGDLVERARAVAPDLPILVVTALARRLTDPRLSAAGVHSVFAKPVDLDQLCRALFAATAPTRKEDPNAPASG